MQYWFDNDDEREIVKHNAKYQMCSTIEDTINSVFVAAERKKEHFMTATEIQQKLRGLLLTADVPTLSKLGRALRRQHIPDGSQNGIHGYYLHLRKQNQ